MRATAASRLVRLAWRPPVDPDFAYVVITRAPSLTPGATPAEVFRGRATAFTDRSVLNGVEYRYTIVAYDRADNRSRGVAVVALPKAMLRTAPRPGARVTGRPVLAWARVSGAAYYNVQLYRGETKVWSGWPARPRVRLPARWSFGGRRHTLRSGVYRWFVWPGFGARGEARYGELLGTSTFTVVRLRR